MLQVPEEFNMIVFNYPFGFMLVPFVWYIKAVWVCNVPVDHPSHIIMPVLVFSYGLACYTLQPGVPLTHLLTHFIDSSLQSPSIDQSPFLSQSQVASSLISSVWRRNWPCKGLFFQPSPRSNLFDCLNYGQVIELFLDRYSTSLVSAASVWKCWKNRVFQNFHSS